MTSPENESQESQTVRLKEALHEEIPLEETIHEETPFEEVSPNRESSEEGSIEKSPSDRESSEEGSMEESPPNKDSIDQGSPENGTLDDDIEEVPVLDIPETTPEVTEATTTTTTTTTSGSIGPVEPNQEQVSKAGSQNQHPLDALVTAYNGVGLATNILAACAISVLITTRHFAATRKTESKGTPETGSSEIEDGSGATTTGVANKAPPSEPTDDYHEDFVIATLSKIACHGLLPECQFTFASLIPLDDSVEPTNDENDPDDNNSILFDHRRNNSILFDHRRNNSILFDHRRNNSILFDPSELPSTDETSATKPKVTTAKGKKWRDRVLARKRRQQQRQNQPATNQETQPTEVPPPPHKLFRQPSEGSLGISKGTGEDAEMIHPSLDDHSTPSEVAPPSVPGCSVFEKASVAEEPAPESLSSVSTTETEPAQQGFAQLVIELSGTVGVCWMDYPCGASVKDATEDPPPGASDTASFVTAMHRKEHFAPDTSSVYSFFTAVSGDMEAASDGKCNSSVSVGNHSVMERVFEYFHRKWNYESASANPFQNASLTTAVMDTTDTAKGSIWEWITGIEPQISVFSSSSVKEVLDSANNDLLLEETVDDLEVYLFGQDQQGKEPKSSNTFPNDTVDEKISIELILEDSPMSRFDNEYSSNVDVVVFGHDWRSSKEVEPSIANSGYFCCWFDGRPSGKSSVEDVSKPNKSDTPIPCDASLVSTLASTNISSSSSKASKASSWFGKHYKQPWYVMPTLDPLGETDGGSSDGDGDDPSETESNSDMSRLTILRELHRFQTGLCSDRVMEMVHFQTNDPQPTDGNVVASY